MLCSCDQQVSIRVLCNQQVTVGICVYFSLVSRCLCDFYVISRYLSAMLV